MAQKEIPYKIYLEESEMPRDWYNVRADMVKKPAPLLDPKTGKPITPEELAHAVGHVGGVAAVSVNDSGLAELVRSAID